MKNARQTAFDILFKIQKDAAYSNLALDQELRKSGLDARDIALVSRLVYGVLEREITLDYVLSCFLKQPLRKLKPEVLLLLRMGAYQLLYMERIPPSAAINETVALTRSNRCGYASGLVNGVLRNVQRTPPDFEELRDDPVRYQSVCYSCPEWLVCLWRESYGEEDALALMEAALERPPFTVRCNTLKMSPEKLQSILQTEGMEAVPDSALPDALLLKHSGALECSESFRAGLFHVQDTASQYCAAAVNPQPGERVYDLCSAPGGKAFTMAQRMENRGQVEAFDIYEHRLRLIESGAARLGISIIHTQRGDASRYNPTLGLADRVLCDVPCSGLGILRKKPEIRHKSAADIDKLPDLQYLILCTACKYVKHGGRLVYSTCTLNPAENEQVVFRFLQEHPEFQMVSILPELSQARRVEEMVTLMPHRTHSDGFFLAAMEKTR